MCLDLFLSEDVIVQEELAHELVTVVDPQVLVLVEGASELDCLSHYLRHVTHQLCPHLGEIFHVLHVGLEDTEL